MIVHRIDVVKRQPMMNLLFSLEAPFLGAINKATPTIEYSRLCYAAGSHQTNPIQSRRLPGHPLVITLSNNRQFDGKILMSH